MGNFLNTNSISLFEKEIITKNKELKSVISNISKCDWPVFSKRFVAFFDVAGFKATSKYLYYSYSLLLAFKDIVNQTEHYKTYDGTKYIEMIAVSDSIIIFSRDDSPTSFCCFCNAIGYLFNRCLLFKRMMNVVVAYGDLAVDKKNQVFCGEPFNRAYTLQEKMDYYGILCDPSINDYLSQNIGCKVEGFAMYADHFLDVYFFWKAKDSKTLTKGCYKNYFWYDESLYRDALYTKVKWGNEKIGLCSDDGFVSGTYQEIITDVIETYGNGEQDKIKMRLNNTMDVLESMLAKQRCNNKQRFERYKLEKT